MIWCGLVWVPYWENLRDLRVCSRVVPLSGNFRLLVKFFHRLILLFYFFCSIQLYESFPKTKRMEDSWILLTSFLSQPVHNMQHNVCKFEKTVEMVSVLSATTP